jgi:hypothetical protein
VLDKFEQRFDAQVRWDTDKSEWNLDKLVEFRGEQPRPTELLETEELDAQKLNDLKTALGDLKIVGVLRKPEGLGADLKAGTEIMNNNESLVSLVNRGFFPVTIGGGAPELRAANGEVLVGMKNGVEYVLRFGEIASVENATEEEGKLNRYLFVMARLDESKFPPLELEPLPGAESADEQAASDQAPAGKNATQGKPDGKETAGSDSDGGPDTAQAVATEPPSKDATEPATKDAKQPPAKAVESDQVKDADGKATQDESKPDAKAAKDQPAGEEEKSELELARERIRKENQRKKDEREEELKTANQRIRELNARFGDWYYIIAEDEYHKIRLGRDDLIKELESAAEEGFGIDAFRKLQKDGLKKEAEAGASNE